ncbi:hypothetical protein COLO4_27412 [Corchorus olitorius]|uniref:Uncharacterized protein n=1 Tax=Corchorus olitorius TaxID=93759 RepID=A0A1R3HRE4_9ROSI|nr:hypothetical protein COLO4_27412 [Corchorus olitorius]
MNLNNIYIFTLQSPFLTITKEQRNPSHYYPNQDYLISQAAVTNHLRSIGHRRALSFHLPRDSMNL